MKNKIVVLFFFLFFCTTVQASLTIHGIEFGVGKFHRYDNKIHSYDQFNAWKNYIFPDSLEELKLYTQKNADGSYSIFFTNLQELLETAKQIADQTQEKIAIFNIEAHGLPGGMWYPKDAEERDGLLCYQWSQMATGADEDNYAQYYSPVSKNDIMSIRSFANSTGYGSQPCVTGLNEWREIIGRIPNLSASFTPDATLRFISCVVGLGARGDQFTIGLAETLFGNSQGRVVTSVNFGLGDWSMPEGMGFWDYQTDEQLSHDNAIYPKDKTDREVMQKGSARMAKKIADSVKSQIFAEIQFLPIDKGFEESGKLIPAIIEKSTVAHGVLRIPGTNIYLEY